MFGMLRHIRWRAGDPLNKKVRASQNSETLFQEIKTVNEGDTLKLGNHICKISHFDIRYG